MTSHDPIDLALGSILPARYRIQFGLRHNHLLIGPTHGDELADEWHLQFAVHFLVLFLVRMFRKPARDRVEEGEVAVLVFIFDKSRAHDDMRIKDKRNEVGGVLRIRMGYGNHMAAWESAIGLNVR